MDTAGEGEEGERVRSRVKPRCTGEIEKRMCDLIMILERPSSYNKEYADYLPEHIIQAHSVYCGTRAPSFP